MESKVLHIWIVPSCLSHDLKYSSFFLKPQNDLKPNNSWSNFSSCLAKKVVGFLRFVYVWIITKDLFFSASSSAGTEEEPDSIHNVRGLLKVPEHWFTGPWPLRGGALLLPVCQRLPVPHGLQTQREEPQSILLQFKPERPEQRSAESDAQPPATAGQAQGEEGQEEEEGKRAAEPDCR